MNDILKQLSAIVGCEHEEQGPGLRSLLFFCPGASGQVGPKIDRIV